MQKVGAKPFVKWAGGKGQLLARLTSLMPKSFHTYYEPFLGGGALFFHLQPRVAVLNDVNKTLIGAYRSVQKNPQRLVEILSELEERYRSLRPEARRNFYNKIRDAFNHSKSPSYQKSAYLVFLNRTCFNGLYRENASGKFNVPFGAYKNPTICSADLINADSQALQNAKLLATTFDKAVAAAGKGDFVYFDPPYHPLSKTSQFTTYSQGGFLEREQVKLFETFCRLNDRGCMIMLSNSYTPFIRKLYADFRQQEVGANRAINSRAAKRGKISELIIMNY